MLCVHLGGRDHEGRTIVTIPSLEKGAERPREELMCTLYYLVNTVSEEVRENGFAMILDGRGYSWQSVKQTLKMLQVQNALLLVGYNSHTPV